MARLKNQQPPIKKTKPYRCHRQFQPQVRSTIRVKNRNDRLGAQPTSATEDRDSNESNRRSDRFLDPWNTDDSEPASGRPEWFLRGQLHCNGRWRWCSFSGCGFLYCRLHPTGGAVPDVLSRWPSGANPPFSISLDPSQPRLSLRRPKRTCGAEQETSFSFLAT